MVSDRTWLTAFLLPAYAPDLNPVEGVWAHVKRSLAHLAVIALDRLETLVRNRLKRFQYRPGTPDGFIAGTGLTLDTQQHLDEPKSVGILGTCPILSDGSHSSGREVGTVHFAATGPRIRSLIHFRSPLNRVSVYL